MQYNTLYSTFASVIVCSTVAAAVCRAIECSRLLHRTCIVLGRVLFCTFVTAAPSAPQNLRVANATVNQMRVAWDAPVLPNGKIKRYLVFLGAPRSRPLIVHLYCTGICTCPVLYKRHEAAALPLSGTSTVQHEWSKLKDTS